MHPHPEGLWKQLKDLAFTDDLTLLSHKHQHAPKILSQVAEAAEKTGFEINILKMDAIQVNNR